MEADKITPATDASQPEVRQSAPIMSSEKKEDGNDDNQFPIHATHPAVVAVCNVLMHDSPTEFQTWHCPAEHVRTRDTMEQCISHLILQRRPTANMEWIEKLPEVSKKIERNLYFSARSIDEYSDPYTLVNRIQGLVKGLIATAATQPPPPPLPEIQKSAEQSDGEGQDNDDEDADSDAAPEPRASDPTLAGITQAGQPTKSDLLQAPLYLVPLKEAEIAQQQVATVSNSLGGPLYLPSRQVSSQGCSRVFIIKVLISVSEFVKGKSLPSIFTFKRELVMDWLISAKQACCLPTYMAEEGYYGGPPFVDPDPSTHWSEPHQLYTWWKNNVERRSKFKVLQEDARYKGLDPRRLQRARWCEAVVALSEVIRASSGSTNAARSVASVVGMPGVLTGPGVIGGPVGGMSGLSGLSSGITGLGQMGHPSAYIQALTASANSNNSSHLLYGYTNGVGVVDDPGCTVGGNSSVSASDINASDDIARKGVDALMNMNFPSMSASSTNNATSSAGSGVYSGDRAIPAALDRTNSAGSNSTGNGFIPGLQHSSSTATSSVYSDAAAFLSAYNAVAGATSTVSNTAGKGDGVAGADGKADGKGGGKAEEGTASHLLPYLPQQHLSPLGSTVKSEFPLPLPLSPSATTPAPTTGHPAESYRADIFPLSSGLPASLMGLTAALSGSLGASTGGLNASLSSSLGNGMSSGGLGSGLGANIDAANRLAREDTPQSYMMASKYPVPMMTTMIPGTNIPYRNYSNTFPVKLFDLVSSEDEAVVGWQGHGTSFQVRDMEKFVNIVLPKHFKHNNFTSFQRQLNLYGFRRSASYDKGAYYHPQFQQGQRELAESIRRVLAPSSGSSHHQDMSYSNMSYGIGMQNMMHPLMSYMPQGMQGMNLPASMSTINMGMPMMNIQNMQNIGMMGMPLTMQYSGAAESSSSLDPAAESLLGMSQPQSQTDASSSSAAPNTNATTPAPLPLPQWINPQSYYSNLLASGAQGANYWQTLAMNGNLGALNGNISAMNKMNPYLMAQNPYLNQYPFAYPGMEGMPVTNDSMYNYNGTYNIMSQLRNFHPITGKPIVPPRGYNRNTKRHREHEVDAQGNRKVRLSARDRKLLDMHTAEGFNAEQFLAGTARSDRYNLAGKSTLLGAARRRKKGSTDGDEGDEAHRGRGRPKGTVYKREDETSYQDGDDGDDTRRSHRRSKKSKHPDSDSSESDGAPTKRRSAGPSRTSSYKNLPAEVLAKSGLSRNSAITHLTENAEEDLIDLRNPQRRRIYLDFTVNGSVNGTKEEAGTDGADEDGSDYVCGFYKGALTQGKADIGLHCVLHGSRTLAEALLRIANESPDPQPFAASMIAAQNKDNAPRATRIGDDYQCDIPALLPLPNLSSAVTRRAAVTSVEGLVWRPNVLSTECVDDFVELLKARKRMIPLPVGTVLVVHLAAENAYRLCCVLDVFFSNPNSAGASADDNTTPADTTVRVFDGYEDWVVPAAQCMSFKEGEMEQALQILVKHQGQLTPALVEEVDWLLRSEVALVRPVGTAGASTGVPGASAVWTADEVQTFCHAVKRHGDNIRKVWELRFAETKKLADVQEFFLCIYPHTQLGGAKRVVNVYYRGELAAAGFPDGEGGDGSDAEQGDLVSVSTSSDASSSETEDEVEDSDSELPPLGSQRTSDQGKETGRSQGQSQSSVDTELFTSTAPVGRSRTKDSAPNSRRPAVPQAAVAAAAVNGAGNSSTALPMASRSTSKSSTASAPANGVAAGSVSAPVSSTTVAVSTAGGGAGGAARSRKRVSLPPADEVPAVVAPAASKARAPPTTTATSVETASSDKGAETAKKRRR